MKIIPVLYEDNEIIAVNKESGLAVQGGAGVGLSLDEALSRQLGYKIFLVHRLDKDTAGILLVAKNRQAAAKYTALMGSGALKKEYLAFCIGCPEKKQGVITEPVTRKGQAKTAVTEYSVIKSAPVTLGNQEQSLSEMHIRLGTGRMHQIRIHLAKQNCPILADDKYGNFQLNKTLKKEFKISILQLAALKLTFPTREGRQNLEIPVPAHMALCRGKIFPDLT